MLNSSRHLWHLVTVSSLALLASTQAEARIIGGEAVQPCGWPTTVVTEVGGGAGTGTLIHPRVVVYSAHSSLGVETVVFTDDRQGATRRVDTEYCRAHPDWQATGGMIGEGIDIAYCLLNEAVDDLPIVPILMGCEVDKALHVGAEVVLAGFGAHAEGPQIDGIKREVRVEIAEIGEREILVGGDGKGACIGDSGGPAYVQLEDGSWRVFGVTSWGPDEGCTSGRGWYGTLHGVMDWLDEELSGEGIDLTPCHAADGSWQPTARCRDFPLEPDRGGGSWPDECDTGPLSDWSKSCGPAFPDVDDSGTDESSDTGDSDDDESETEGSTGPSDSGEAETTSETETTGDIADDATDSGSNTDDDDASTGEEPNEEASGDGDTTPAQNDTESTDAGCRSTPPTIGPLLRLFLPLRWRVTSDSQLDRRSGVLRM